jgi:hypothetical protein
MKEIPRYQGPYPVYSAHAYDYGASPKKWQGQISMPLTPAKFSTSSDNGLGFSWHANLDPPKDDSRLCLGPRPREGIAKLLGIYFRDEMCVGRRRI